LQLARRPGFTRAHQVELHFHRHRSPHIEISETGSQPLEFGVRAWLIRAPRRGADDSPGLSVTGLRRGCQQGGVSTWPGRPPLGCMPWQGVHRRDLGVRMIQITCLNIPYLHCQLLCTYYTVYHLRRPSKWVISKPPFSTSRHSPRSRYGTTRQTVIIGGCRSPSRAQ